MRRTNKPGPTRLMYKTSLRTPSNVHKKNPGRRAEARPSGFIRSEQTQKEARPVRSLRTGRGSRAAGEDGGEWPRAVGFLALKELKRPTAAD